MGGQARAARRLAHAGGFTDGVGAGATTPAVADARFASEGHGTYRGKLDEDWDKIFAERVMGPLLGRSAAPERPKGEVEWFRVDSACRQHIWGEWSGGLYKDDTTTPQPAPDATGWPTRTLIQEGCPFLRPGPPSII